MGRLTPLIMAAASLSRNRMGLATSCGVAKRRSGIAASIGPLLAGSLQARSAIGVRVTVGLTLLTRMPLGPSSRHRLRVMASSAAYRRAFGLYRDAYPALQGLMHRIHHDHQA